MKANRKIKVIFVNFILVSLFTGAEKILLAKSNVDYRYTSNKEDLIEQFTLKNLDSVKEKVTENIHTRSLILAPFNSSYNSSSEFLNKELKTENYVIKFAGKLKEMNRQYELNNNGEIDNGIIISPCGTILFK